MITMFSIKTTENNDDRGRQYRIVLCFRDHGSLCGFVCEIFSSFRTHEAVDIVSGLFRSSWFISGLTMFDLRKHQLEST